MLAGRWAARNVVLARFLSPLSDAQRSYVIWGSARALLAGASAVHGSLRFGAIATYRHRALFMPRA